MIKIEKTEVVGWEAAIRGMRNPKNSWERSDSGYGCEEGRCNSCVVDPFYDRCPNEYQKYIVGPNDLDLMMRLAKGGPAHAKYLRYIVVYVDVTAPLYWWKEFETYRIGVAENPSDIEMNSCSTMHKIHDKEITLDDFSCEHLDRFVKDTETDVAPVYDFKQPLEYIVKCLNDARNLYLETKDKKYWRQMIQLLPSSYNQKRTLKMNYQVLANIYKSRKGHRLDEWRAMLEWIESLPYSELITGKD